MTTFWIASIFTLIILVSIYIHNNMKDTKICNFVNKHIIANEDDFIK
jgi:uncharacterized membrane protein YhaH (DUF805 family)